MNSALKTKKLNNDQQVKASRILELVKFDKKYSKKNIVIGTDEVGRGPVAGPVVACALYFPVFNKELNEALKYLDDSKKFSSNPKLRKEISEEIKKYALYSIAECSVQEIEKHNILQASLIAMKRSCEDLLKIINLSEKEPVILIDGRFKIPKYTPEQVPVVKGDTKSASIAAASIMAKVYRDELMQNLGKDHPYYNWEKNKGYPTKAHIEAIKKHGTCKWHRKSFLTKILAQ